MTSPNFTGDSDALEIAHPAIRGGREIAALAGPAEDSLSFEEVFIAAARNPGSWIVFDRELAR